MVIIDPFPCIFSTVAPTEISLTPAHGSLARSREMQILWADLGSVKIPSGTVSVGLGFRDLLLDIVT